MGQATKFLICSAVAVLSGPGGATLRTFNIKTGAMLWDAPLHPSHLGRLSEPPKIGSDISFIEGGRGNVVVLTNGHTLRKISSGNTQWTWTADDAT
jgi:ER membrane protein complex subunit 1